MVKNVAQAIPNRQLQAARKAHGWTQSEVAERIGASSPLNVTRWERGTTFPSAFYLKKLCQLFDKTPQELGLLPEEHTVPERHGGSRDATLSVPFWNVPYRRNLFFTRREEVLRLLHERLLTNEQQTTLLPAYAFCGLGGIGKTQLAIEYAYRFRQQYHAVFWMRATSQETLLADFSSLAHLLMLPQSQSQNQDQLVIAVKRWLTEHGKWLLILDNADDLSLVSGFLPASGEGHLLLTTRATATGTLASSIAVEQMEQDEGALLLLRRSKLLAADAPLVTTEPQRLRQAYALVDLLDGLPLALDQAGSYIEESGCSLQEYLELYQQSRITLLNRRSTVLTDYPYTVASTWSLSLRQVKQQSPAAAELLRLMALLDPDAIAESLLREGASFLGPILGPVAADPFQLNEAIQVLRRFSLVQRNPETKRLSLHRLVQVVIQEEMDAQTRQAWIERVVALLKAAFPEPDGEYFPSLSWYQELLPHIQVSADLMERFHVLTLDGAHLLKRAAMYLAPNYTRNVLTERLSQLALKIYEQQGLLEHPDAADLFSYWGMGAYAMGRFDQARSFHQRSFDIRQRVLGTDHPGVALSYNGLGLVYWSLAHYDQAEAMYQQALALLRTLGPEHLYTAVVLLNFGDLACSQKHYEQAERLLQRALVILEQFQDLHHPALALCLSNMGSVYSAQHRYDKAEEVLLRAQAVYEQDLGPNFILAGRAFSILGELYHVQGRHAEADVVYHRAVAIFEQEPDSDHPVIAKAFARLAKWCAEQDRDEEASSLYQRALGIYERGVGTNHPEAVETRKYYAALLRKMIPSKASSTSEPSSYDPSLEPGEQDHGRTSSELPSSPHILPITEPLTRREREVLRFLAQGLTSSQISQELTMRVHTVNTHIRSIYTKLNITTRSAATRYALEHQLL
jgi:tetratricopeptide (TPR) repeat protein/DNA-binding CsgD family transcriptional regulator/transcriptional regulator with XRE-family HTH domain